MAPEGRSRAPGRNLRVRTGAVRVEQREGALGEVVVQLVIRLIGELVRAMRWMREKTHTCIGSGIFRRLVFALVRPALDTFFALLSLTVDAAGSHAVFYTAFARAILVASFTGGGTVGALETKLGRDGDGNENEAYSHFDLFPLRFGERRGDGGRGRGEGWRGG